VVPPASKALSALRIVRLVLVFVIGVPVLLFIAGAIVYALLDERKNLVVFDNGTAQTVEVFIDGQRKGQVGGKGDLLSVHVDDGEHAVRLESGGRVVEESRFATGKRAGFWGHGLRAIYSVGGKTRYALVTVVYVAPGASVTEENEVNEIASSGHLVELPREYGLAIARDLDRAFPETTSIPEGKKLVKETHVCRLDRLRKVGCPGYRAE
jgi:hypothetical protein